MSRKDKNAIAALDHHMSLWPAKCLTVWSSGKVHSGFGSIGANFSSFAIAEAELVKRGYARDYESSGFVEFSRK